MSHHINSKNIMNKTNCFPLITAVGSLIAFLTPAFAEVAASNHQGRTGSWPRSDHDGHDQNRSHGCPPTTGTNFWSLGGNSGTSAGTNFLGTTDDQPLEFKVNGERALRLEPNAEGAPNVIGGSSANYAAPGIVGAVVAGGGASDFTNHFNGVVLGRLTNSVFADFCTNCTKNE